MSDTKEILEDLLSKRVLVKTLGDETPVIRVWDLEKALEKLEEEDG